MAKPVESLSSEDQAAIRSGIGLGTAATQAAGAFATAAQGTKADEAVSLLLINAKGDLIAGTGNDAAARLPVGTAGQKLTPDAAEATGLKWVPPSPAPSAFTSRVLTNADDGATLVCGSAQTATVNTGLWSGFGCAIKGSISFDGTATVTDVRTSGAANPWCALVQTGTDTYDAVGGKA